MSEAAIMNQIRIAVSDAGHVCFRANIGLFFTKDGRPVSTGLPNGFSDLFGFTSGGVPFFFEVKKPGGKVSADQQRFLEAMRNRGALACVVRSVDDALKVLK